MATTPKFNWTASEDACHYLIVLYQEFEHLSPQQRTDLFNRRFGTAVSVRVIRDTYNSRFQGGRSQMWRVHDNQDNPDQQERARRNAVRNAQVQAVCNDMRALGLEDMTGDPPIVNASRRFRLCGDALTGCKLVDLTFSLDTKHKLLQVLIDQGVLEEGTTDAQFHLEGEDCSNLRPLADAVVVEATNSAFTPGKLKGRWIELH